MPTMPTRRSRPRRRCWHWPTNATAPIPGRRPACKGLGETLTVLRLGVPPTLARTLRSTNCIESMISVCREHAANVKRWRDGQMALRWCAAGMIEAGKQFRRVNGHLHLPSLRAALEREIAEPLGPDVHNDEVSAA